MDHVLRIVDTDRDSLEERVSVAIGDQAGECVVKHFTHWFTGRPPVHEATVVRLPHAA